MQIYMSRQESIICSLLIMLDTCGQEVSCRQTEIKADRQACKTLFSKEICGHTVALRHAVTQGQTEIGKFMGGHLQTDTCSRQIIMQTGRRHGSMLLTEARGQTYTSRQKDIEADGSSIRLKLRLCRSLSDFNGRTERWLKHSLKC